jgi:hypothetical protein
MKKMIAVLFILVFLLSLGGFSAHAQAVVQKTSFAFIPLISPGEDTSGPIVFRARDAFNTLAPRLLEAQTKGEVVRFEPEFDHGLLKVEYQTGFELASALEASSGVAPQVFDNPKAVLDYIHVSRNQPTGLTASPQAADPYLLVGVYDTCFSGSNWGAGNMYEVTLYDTAMHLLTSKTSTVDGSGDIDDCLFDTGVWNYMIPGYTFTIKQFDSGHTYPPLHTYTTIIPRLNISAVTPKTRTFKGIGPVNDQVWFEVIHEELDSGNNETYTYTGGPTSSKGAWSIKLDPSVAIRGGDYYGIAWPNPDTITTTFVFYRGLYMPAIDCQLGGSTCGAYGIPGKAAKLTLKHAKKNYKDSGKFDFTGWYGGNFVDANTDPVFMVPGDTVSGSGSATMTIPALTAIPDRVADTISGIAPASSYFYIKLKAFFHTTDEWKTAWHWVGSAGNGTYTEPFSGSFAIDTADFVVVSIYYVNPLTGNETDYWNYVLYP